MEDCIFCKIVRKEVPAEIVYEDDKVMAFKDIQPSAPVHLLFIPKKHISTFFDLEEDDKDVLGAIHLAVVKVAKEMGLEEQGFRLVSNCKGDAGQLVFHLHFHLLGGRLLKWPPG